MGKDCPHVREKGSGKQNKDLYELAFSISYDHGEEEAYLNFIAPSKRDVSVWAGLLGEWAGEQMARPSQSWPCPSLVLPVDRRAKCPAGQYHGQ